MNEPTNNLNHDFDEYIRQGEPSRLEKVGIWQTAIGLQQVAGLRPSRYLIEQAKLNIEGDITIDEVKKRIDAYYKTQTTRQTDPNDRTEEADKVSANVGEMSERQNKILATIAADKTISARQLSESLNITSRTIERELKKMKDMNIIARIGGDRGGHWKILTKENLNE